MTNALLRTQHVALRGQRLRELFPLSPMDFPFLPGDHELVGNLH